MISSRRMLKSLAALLPLGAAGVSMALAATPARPIEGDPTARDVARHLQTIREAVSEVTGEQAGSEPDDPNVHKAWWANGRPGWRNGGWRNWRNGWGNGPWHNGWSNFAPWHNWHNLWRNW